MPNYTEKIDRKVCRAIPVFEGVPFPFIQLGFEISDKKSIDICERAKENGEYVLLVPYENPKNTPVVLKQMGKVGVISEIKQIFRLPQGSARIVCQGISRATVTEYSEDNGVITASCVCKTLSYDDFGGMEGQALKLEINKNIDIFASQLNKVSPDIIAALKNEKDISLYADLIASHLLINYDDVVEILYEFDPLKRLIILTQIMNEEADILKLNGEIHKRVQNNLDRHQREYFLREQLHQIKMELNESSAGDDSDDDEIDEYYEKIMSVEMPEGNAEKLMKEVKKLSKMPYASAESSVIRSYLDICLEIPWQKATKDRVDVEAARKILNRDHDGLDKVKERILEYLAVKQLNPELKNQIICLVGPPGTGKTSVVQSIASATKRKYARVCLGGVRDEADIRGHRKTYLGSMPGRIVNALITAGVKNPIILLDEIDKMSSDGRGDPASALLEVLDSEQNKSFRDHFVEVPVDLSDCIFIATANTLQTVPAPLIDRMEIIELKSYSRNEKLSIANNHLVPKQLKRHGLNKRMVKITDDAILGITDFYTEEAGVRNLEREIGSLCRKAALKFVDNPELKKITVDAGNLEEMLGPHKVIPVKINDENQIGVVNGLAYTESGGDLLQIECAAMEGTGKLELTGSLGDVMKESAHAAVTFIRSHSSELGVDKDFYKNRDIHIHVPEGAVPKDGPSAGVTIATALLSELSSRPVKRDVAMTGEITLRGRVLAIGGLKEKTMAAYKAGVRTVLIPYENKRDIPELDKTVRENLTFIPCSNVSEVFANALEERNFAINVENDASIQDSPVERAAYTAIPNISNNESCPVGLQ